MRASTRDYKRRQKPSLELWKMREFGMGALVGIILAGSATVFIMNARQHEAAVREKNEAPRPDPHRKAPADPEAYRHCRDRRKIRLLRDAAQL